MAKIISEQKLNPTEYPIDLHCWKCDSDVSFEKEDFSWCGDDEGERILCKCPKCKNTLGWSHFSYAEKQEFKSKASWVTRVLAKI